MNFTGRLRFRRDSRVLSPRSVFLRAFPGLAGWLAGLFRRAMGVRNTEGGNDATRYHTEKDEERDGTKGGTTGEGKGWLVS